MADEISRKFIEANSPFSFKKVIQDRQVACDFIEWALLKIDCRLEDVPQIQGNRRTFQQANNIDDIINDERKQLDRAKLLAHRTSILGLCKSTDTELIVGSAPSLRLYEFYGNLLTIVQSMPSFSENEFKPSNQSMDEITRSCGLLDGLASNPDALNSILSQKYDLFPRDLDLLINSTKSNETQRLRPSALVATEGLQLIREEKVKEAQGLQDEMRRLKEGASNIIVPEENDKKESIEKLTLVGADIKQQLSSFVDLYESELSHWVNNKEESRELSAIGSDDGLGPRAETAINGIKKLRQYLEDLQTIRTSYENIVSNIPDNTGKPISRPIIRKLRYGGIMKTVYSTLNEPVKSNVMEIVNKKGETGLEAITRLETTEEILKVGVSRRERE
ncbi:hypothetical protein G9A89_009657 [Geosiphon pyriformis]|nr:hypothetical protein G9A89_009657 [Geosiphon pyriformis]